MPSVECLNENTVVAFLNARLPDPAREAVERHVAACTPCSELLTWAAADAARGIARPLPGALHPGTRVDRYQILETVGRGGMGEVFAAYHPDLDRRIALKVVNERGPGTAERRVRLLREARAIARLSHPNVITVHDAGTFGDRVYVAMEFVDGLTIDRWLAAAPRSWREVLNVFLAAGRGLAAAHAAGIVHRDFKPQNVMIGRNGSVRVMDFGLARLAEESGDRDTARSDPDRADALDAAPGLPTVTRAGTVIGTPAYMAPEQFKGDAADARSDQFSFCVALYEALLGERPFQGEHILSLSLSVTEGEVRAPPRATNLPAWVRRPILRGLRPDPADRHPSMDALIDALADDPAVRRRRRAVVAISLVVLAAGLTVARQAVLGRQRALESKIAALVERAAAATREGKAGVANVHALRNRAFTAFDSMDRVAGESLWGESLSAARVADHAYDQAEQANDAALVLDPSRADIRQATARLLVEHLALANEARFSDKALSLTSGLATHDPDGSIRRQLAAPAALSARIEPPGATVVLERYERDPITRRRIPGSVPFAGPAQVTALPAGTYRLSAHASGYAPASLPFMIDAGERKAIVLALPRGSSIPDGFIFVPAGEFLYGDADEQLRTEFLNTVPIHRRTTGAFLIAANETTYRDWIDFLSSLPEAERARHAPNITSQRGELRLRQSSDRWQLSFQPTTRRYSALLGETFAYVGRKQRSRQDWSRFPVAGVSSADVLCYLDWLRKTRRVPGARLCTEVEWERAARGADDRLYPHGDELAMDDGNFDRTYDRTDGAYGPDEVGSHPASRSPFGVDDLAGNVYELVSSSEKTGGLVIRGGAYYFGAITARSTNREPVPASFTDVSTGIRVCADITAR